jgi:hypothetical protein
MYFSKRWTLAPLPILVLLCLQSSYLWAQDPATLYMMECQGCHLADGAGGLDSVPILQDNVARYLTVPGGREFLVQVPGVALSSLSDQDTTAVLNWMLTTFGPIALATQYAPYTVEEVASLRKHPQTDIGSRRAELMLLMEKLKSTDAPG